MLKKILGVLGLVAGVVIAIVLAVVRSGQKLPGDGSAAQQAGDRLADGQAGVSKAVGVVADAEVTAGRVAESAVQSADAVDDGLSVLEQIRKANGG